MKIAHTGVATAKNTSSGTYPTVSTISGAHTRRARRVAQPDQRGDHRRHGVAGQHQPPGLPPGHRAEPQQRLGQVEVRDAAEQLHRRERHGVDADGRRGEQPRGDHPVQQPDRRGQPRAEHQREAVAGDRVDPGHIHSAGEPRRGEPRQPPGAARGGHHLLVHPHPGTLSRGGCGPPGRGGSIGAMSETPRSRSRAGRPRRRPHRPVHRRLLAARGLGSHAGRRRPRHRQDARGGRRRHPRRRAGRARRRRRRPARFRRDAAARARRDPAPRLRADHVADRRPRPAHDPRDGQADRRVEGRDHLRGGVLPLVRRGGRADRRAVRGGPERREPLPRHAPARRGVPAGHPVELPDGHGHPQDRAGGRRRLHDGDQARAADPAVDARPRRDPRRGRPARRRAQRRDHLQRRRR